MKRGGSIYWAGLAIGMLLCLIGCRQDADLPGAEENNSNSTSTDSVEIQWAGFQLAQNQPTVGIVRWTTSRPVSTWLEWWTDADTFYSNLLPPADTQQATLSGIPAEKKCFFRACVELGGVPFCSPIDSFTTGTWPGTTPQLSLTNAGGPDGKTLILANKNFVPSALFLMNEQGQLVWHQDFTESMEAFDYTWRQTFVVLLNKDIIREIDLFGNTLNEITISRQGWDNALHHDVWLDENGNYVVLYRLERDFDLSSAGGNSQSTVLGDGFRIYSPQGQIVLDWNIFDHYHPLNDPEILNSHSDWGHANSVRKDRNGDFLISFRNFSQVWKVDGDNGNVVWKLGAQGDFQLPPSAIFIRQHYAFATPAGTLYLFDNGDSDRPVSRAVELSLNESAMTAEIVHITKFPGNLYSSRQGSAVPLPDGRVLMCSSDNATFVITDKNGTPLRQIQSDFRGYRAEYFPGIHGKPPVKINRPPR